MSRFSYQLHRRLWLARYRLRRRFTPTGVVVLLGLVVTAMLGLDTEQSFAYQAFAFLGILLLFAWLFVPFFRGRFNVQLAVPRYGSVGCEMTSRILMRNATRKAQRGLSVMLDLAEPFASAEEYRAHQLSLRRHRSFRLGQSPPRRPHAMLKEVPLGPMRPGEETEVAVEILPLRRGRLRFRGVTVARTDPFGLMRSLLQLPLVESVIVLPKRYPLPPLALPGTLKYQQGGVTLASSVGESQEYVFLRDYRRGDPLRHVHWKSWAHTGKPIVKEFQDEYFVRHALILDTFVGPDDEEIFEEVISIAASFAYTIRTQESLLDLMFVGTEAFCFTAGRGLARTEQILEVLASVTVCRDRNFEALERLVLEHTGTLSGCIVVLQSWDEPRQRLTRQLRALRLPMVVLVVTKNRITTNCVPSRICRKLFMS